MSEKKSWQAAENYCRNMAPANTTANLASVGDDATNMFLSTLTSGEEAWIGGQQDNVGVWSWSDGRNWNFTSWATGRVDTLIFLLFVLLKYLSKSYFFNMDLILLLLYFNS